MWYVMSTHSAVTVTTTLWRVASRGFSQKHDAEEWKADCEATEKHHRFFLIHMEADMVWPR